MFKNKFIILAMVLGFIVPNYSFAAVGDYTGTFFSISASGNANPFSLTEYDDFFWITDTTDAEVYKYNGDGTYTGVHFDTSGTNTFPAGITYYNGFFWILDTGGKEIEKYNLDGTYAGISLNIELSPFNTFTGLVAYNDFFWVVDDNTNEVYEFDPDGIYTNVHFDTNASGNGNPYGITVQDGAFWVTDLIDREVYKYNGDGTYASFSFDTNVNGNSTLYGITAYNDFFWTIDQTDVGVYKYSALSDIVPPSVTTLSPLDGATEVVGNANLVITFDEAVDVDTGNITIKKSSDDSAIEIIDVASGLVTGTGTTTITVNPSGDLDEDTAYYVQIDGGAFSDASDNYFAGIADETTWNFGRDINRSSSGSRRAGNKTAVIENNISINTSSNTEGCTASYAYSPITGANAQRYLHQHQKHNLVH